MKVELPDGTPIEELFAEWDKELEKKNFRNWLDKRFPSGIAGGYRASFVISRPWKILRYIRNEIKYSYQRVSRGWDDKAAWDLNYFLAKIIPPILKKLKEDNVGVPGFAFEGLEFEDINTYSYSEETMKIAEARWDSILDEIILGFETYSTLWEIPDYKKEREEYKKVERALDLLKIHFEDLWD